MSLLQRRKQKWEIIANAPLFFTTERLDALRVRLSELREEKRISYDTLATLTGYSTSTVTRYFNGTTKQPTFDFVASVALALGASLDEIAGTRAEISAPLDNPYIDLIRLYQESVARMEEQANALAYNSRHALVSGRITMIVLIAVLACVAAILVYDILHPDRGWFQYAAEFVSGSLAAHL